MRDQLGQSYKTIWVDGEEEYERVLRFVERFQPDLLDRVKFYTRSMPIYDEFNISQELEKALRPKVWLKSGGYLVITQTEALVAIDVNTGKYVGKSDRLEDTIFQTNMEAAEEVVRQMRLRDLGGIVIVDFIDMDDPKNRRGVYQNDRGRLAPRPRAREGRCRSTTSASWRLPASGSSSRWSGALCMPCPTCSGSGIVKSGAHDHLRDTQRVPQDGALCRRDQRCRFARVSQCRQVAEVPLEFLSAGNSRKRSRRTCWCGGMPS